MYMEEKGKLTGTVKHEYCKICRKMHALGECFQTLQDDMVSISLREEICTKVILIGDSGVGKTTLYKECLKSYGVTQPHKSTFTTTVNETDTLIVQLEDTADQEKFNSMTSR